MPAFWPICDRIFLQEGLGHLWMAQTAIEWNFVRILASLHATWRISGPERHSGVTDTAYLQP